MSLPPKGPTIVLHLYGLNSTHTSLSYSRTLSGSSGPESRTLLGLGQKPEARSTFSLITGNLGIP